MNWSTFVTRGKKAMRMSPRVLLARLQDEVKQQTKRPWATAYPHLLTDRTVLGGAASVTQWWESRLDSGPFFLRPEKRERWSSDFRLRYPGLDELLVSAAERVVRHEFDLLGSGPVHVGGSLPWHSDFKTGREWPVRFCKDIEYLELDRPSDVKVPWELSRAQHFPVLGQAFWLTGDERFAREFVAEVTDWIDRNPLAYGVNWACAMDVALRSANWMWGFYFIGASQACADERFRRKFIRALYMHGEFVSRNLETSDINGNHYLSDAVGLVFMGVLFRDTPDGVRWLESGERILTREIEAQIYPDGVDHEGSTPYHRLVLELFLTGFLLLEHAGRAVPSAAWQRLERMLDFVAAYTKPNGQAPLVGDADDGRVQKLGTQDLNDHRYLLAACAARFRRGDHKRDAGSFADEAFWLLGPEGAAAFDELQAAEEPPRSAAFHDGGFYVLRNPSSHLFIDCGDVGMRGRGGHGHNDALSFELYMNGMNAVTDCGAYVYTASRDWRNRFRSTAFHNTVQVDGEELNRFIEPNALWQLHDDARPAGVRFDLTSAGGYWEGGHTGYRRLARPVEPRRSMWLHPEQPLLAIRDVVTGEGRHTLTWRWHFDPACRVTIEGNACRIVSGDRELWLQFLDVAAAMRLDESWVSPSYGVKHPAAVVVVDADDVMPVGLDYVFSSARLTDSQHAAAMSALETAAAKVK